MIEEIMIATGIIKIENTITLSDRSSQSGILFHTDTHVMIQSIDYISDDYFNRCTDFP